MKKNIWIDGIMGVIIEDVYNIKDTRIVEKDAYYGG